MSEEIRLLYDFMQIRSINLISGVSIRSTLRVLSKIVYLCIVIIKWSLLNWKYASWTIKIQWEGPPPPGPRLNIKTGYQGKGSSIIKGRWPWNRPIFMIGMVISIIKIRGLRDRFIFIKGITVLVRRRLYIETEFCLSQYDMHNLRVIFGLSSDKLHQ